MGTVRISGQNFTEAEIVADMYAAVLQKAGYTPDVHLVDTRDVYMKIFPSKVDIVPEYTGSIVEFLNGSYNGANAKPITVSDPQKTIDKAKPLLDKAHITLLTPSAATDTNAFFVTKKYSDDNGVKTLSDLKGKSVVLAAAPDCQGRLDCEGGLSSAYGIHITKILPLGYASPQTYKSVVDGESQLGETSTTDGTLESQGLVLLPDDQQIQPAQNLVPMVSTSFLQQHPDVASPLNALMAKLTTDDLTKLNAEVSVDRQKPEDVAQQWLSDAGLV
jgi:osmoprotectant transport system substrate-binding protein